MGTPDLVGKTQGSIFLDLKTVIVETKTYNLKSLRRLNLRFPRKLKKKLKSIHGENYVNWLNGPIKWTPELNSDIYSYHNVNAEEELTQMLINDINNENNKKD